jgi:hypothetical protein
MLHVACPFCSMSAFPNISTLTSHNSANHVCISLHTDIRVPTRLRTDNLRMGLYLCTQPCFGYQVNIHVLWTVMLPNNSTHGTFGMHHGNMRVKCKRHCVICARAHLICGLLPGGRVQNDVHVVLQHAYARAGVRS